MKVTAWFELKEGYRKPMDEEDTKDVEIVFEVPNLVSAQRMIRKLINLSNVSDYGCSVTED